MTSQNQSSAKEDKGLISLFNKILIQFKLIPWTGIKCKYCKHFEVDPAATNTGYCHKLMWLRSWDEYYSEKLSLDTIPTYKLTKEKMENIPFFNICKNFGCIHFMKSI